MLNLNLMEELIIRVYNVRFGDAIFISIPDEDENGNPKTRYILIDVGNVQDVDGGLNEVFKPVVSDILKILNGDPLDLYIMTHEHLDHVQGLLWTAKNSYSEMELKDKLNIQHSWLPVSSDPDYFNTHLDAKKKNNLATESFMTIRDYTLAKGSSENKFVDILLKNNNRFLESNSENFNSNVTSDCVEYIRQLSSKKNTHYVYRSIGKKSKNIPLYDVNKSHPFHKAKFEIWAPEEDSSEYYGSFTPMALGMLKVDSGSHQITHSPPPSGVDASAYYNLIKYREDNVYNNLLAIDKAANNTSIVFCLKWKGWNLLFSGDAEQRSWKEMDKESIFSPVDFLKISHHGSENGTPDSDILKKLFPDHGTDSTNRSAAISTYHNVYSGIPDDSTLTALKSMGCKISSTLDIEDGKALEFKFKPKLK